MPNLPESIVAALGTAAIGAVWSSCSPDFGVQGVLDRFGQIEPKVLVAADGYAYAGKTHDCLVRLQEIARAHAQRPTRGRRAARRFTAGDCEPRSRRLVGRVPGFRIRARRCAFERLPFDHPLYILYSSGTTGVPKCIVHGAGGTLIQHLKEHQLHCDIRAGDRVFYFTTLRLDDVELAGVRRSPRRRRSLLYDGSPFHPGRQRAVRSWRTRPGMTLFGTSAKFIDAVAKAGLRASSPRTASIRFARSTSTGSPLVAESFDFVYAQIKRDVHLASISGGTDIVGCFVGGNPDRAGLARRDPGSRCSGWRVEVFDEDGQSGTRAEGRAGLHAGRFRRCRSASGTIRTAASTTRRTSRRYPGVWHHGDYVELTEHDGIVIYGRSDAVLNPGGVRIGTAEIYRQVEQVPEVAREPGHRAAVGRRRADRAVRAARRGHHADARAAGSDSRGRSAGTRRPRHVPARIVAVTDIPRTKSGKIVELAVRDVVHGRAVKNLEALANPEALEQYRDRPELER